MPVSGEVACFIIVRPITKEERRISLSITAKPGRSTQWNYNISIHFFRQNPGTFVGNKSGLLFLFDC
jgi:hypothetical protein